jgi:uncharacterized protein involved in type VI secretion and phage assembly
MGRLEAIEPDAKTLQNEGKIPKVGTGKDVEMQDSKEDSLDDKKVHDLRERLLQVRELPTAGRNEGCFST